MEWKLAEAKNRLSEVVSRALIEGPQRIRRRNDIVVVISEQELYALRGGVNPPLDHLMSGTGLEEGYPTRNPSPIHEVELSDTSSTHVSS